MNNKGMFFSVLVVILAAMVIIMLTRPERSSLRTSGAGSEAPVTVADAAGQNSGSSSSVPNGAETSGSEGAQTEPDQGHASAGSASAPSGQATSGQVASGEATPSAPLVQEGTQPVAPAAPDSQIPPVVPQPPVSQPDLPQTPTSLPQSPLPPQPQAPAQPVLPVQPQRTPQIDPAAEQTLSIMALRFAGQGMVLKVQAEEAFTCKSFVLPSPDRLVIDLGGKWANMRAPMVPDNTLIKSARTGRQENAARLVLDLARPLKKHDIVRVSPSEVEIHIE